MLCVLCDKSQKEKQDNRGDCVGDLFELYFSEKMYGKAYKSEEEYLKDKYSFLDMCIAAMGLLIFEHSTTKEGENKSERKKLHVREFPGTLEEAYDSILRKQGTVQEETRIYIKEQLNEAERHIKGRLAYTPYLGKKFKMRFLSMTLRLTELEDFFLLVAGANSYDEKYEKIFVDLQGREGLNHPTFQSTLFLFGLFSEIDYEEAGNLLQKKGTLMESVLDVKKEVEGKPKTYSFALNKRICSYFYGYDGLDNNIKSLAEYRRKDDELSEIYIRQELADRIFRSMQYHSTEHKEKGNVLHIYGPKGNGKKFFLRHAAKKIGGNIIFVDVEKLETLKLEEITMLVSKLILESVLLNAFLLYRKVRFWG